MVFCPNWIGDVVMATPTFRALRRHFVSDRLVAVMRPYVLDTIEGNPWFNDTILYDDKSPDRRRRTLAVMGELRRNKFDVAVLLTNSIRSALVAWFGGCRRRVGYARDGRRLLLNEPLRAPKGRHGYLPSPMIDYYLALAYHLGAPPESYQMELFTSPRDEALADAFWRNAGFTPADRVVAINPGAAFGPAKRWPSQYFAELARKLAEQPGIKVMVLCGPQERGFARFITDASLRPRQVKSLADEAISIGLTKALVRRSSLLVSTDSGPRHFAAAFGVPVVSLFGPTHIEWTDTYYPGETFLQKKLPCGPCQQRTCPLIHHRCMLELDVSTVYQAALRALEGRLPRVIRAG